jgi:hypothetical protein
MKYLLSLLALIPLFTAQTALGAAVGYSRGYADGVCDANRCHGHGFDDSCPANHSAAFCSNYRAGYAAGWNSVSHIPVLPRKVPGSSASSSSSSSSSSSGGTIINKFNPNCRSNC